MEQWYIPITILPGVGLIILSTVNLAGSLGSELDHMIHSPEHQDSKLINMKLKQLNRIGRALVGLYVSAGSFVFAGIVGGLGWDRMVMTTLMVIGVFCVFFSLIILINYASKAVSIKKYQFDFHNIHSDEQ